MEVEGKLERKSKGSSLTLLGICHDSLANFSWKLLVNLVETSRQIQQNFQRLLVTSLPPNFHENSTNLVEMPSEARRVFMELLIEFLFKLFL
jgi:hypothetical protein